MKRKKDKKLPVRNKISFDLELSEDFKTACELFNIDAIQAIEGYLKHVTVYNFLFNEMEGLNHEATLISKQVIKRHFNIENLKIAKHYKHHQLPIELIIKAGIKGHGSTSEEYLNIIDNWHKTISQII